MIFVASCAADRPTWGPVVRYLRRALHRVFVYKSDNVVSGKDRVAIRPESGSLQLVYNGESIDLQKVAAAWYRRTTLFTNQEPHAVRQQTLFREVNALQQALWDQIPQPVWLNSLTSMARAERKLTQLAMAKKIGFTVPGAVVTNAWRPIRALPNDIVFKSSYGTLDAGKDLKVVYTNTFTNNSESLPIGHNPFPGIWQERVVDKAREWRITVVGDEVFCAAIYTDETAKDDWRKHQTTSAVRFKREQFPVALQQKCQDFLRAFQLRFGAFDFIEDSEGRIYFLECNSNGQFGWLEDELGLPISKAIANSLMKIADNS